MPIACIAKERGYFGRIVEQGETFDVPDDYNFDPVTDWFDRVEPPAKAGKTGKASTEPVA